MEVIKKYPENMDGRSQYKLMKSPEVKKMSDAEDSILEVDAWILYSDIDQKTGEERRVCRLLRAGETAEVGSCRDCGRHPETRHERGRLLENG